MNKFIKHMTTEFDDSYKFVLLRFSEEEPFWCVAACKDDSIRGHFCIDQKAGLHEILSSLADSNRNIEIRKDYLKK